MQACPGSGNQGNASYEMLNLFNLLCEGASGYPRPDDPPSIIEKTSNIQSGLVKR